MGLILLAVASCVATRPSRLANAVAFEHREQRFSNGVRVVAHRDDSSPVVSVALAIDTGAGDDPAGREGLAHALEHLAFRAEHEANVPMRLRLDRLGASFNAWTSSEATVYQATAPKASLGELVRAFADLARSPVAGVSPAKLDTERGVLDNERRVRNENGAPGEVVDRLRALVFGDGRLGRPIAGTAQSLRGFTLDDVEAFAKARYRSQGMTFVVSGPLGGDLKALLEPVAGIPASPAAPSATTVAARVKQPALDGQGIAHVPSSVSAPELWLGWRLPGAYGKSNATMEIMANMATGAVASGAWDRHEDVNAARCFLDPGREASMLVCRAWLSSADHAAAVRDSLIRVARKGIATSALNSDWRYLYTRLQATEELLRHESLGWRTQQLLLGAHFARDPSFSVKQVSALEALESSALVAFYERTLTPEAARAVLALPGSAEQLAALPIISPSADGDRAPLPDAMLVAAGIDGTNAERKLLGNGLHAVFVQRPKARFQTALLGFFDGAAREPGAVVDAVRWSYRNLLVEPPTGVLQSLYWDEDAARRVVRGPAGDVHVLLRRLAEGLDHYDFAWKNEQYLDFAAGLKQREADPRESTPRAFRKQLLFDHPYGLPIVSADVDGITPNQIRNWYDAVHRPENALLVIVGPSSPTAMLAAAQDELGSWQRAAKREPGVAPRAALVGSRRTGSRLVVGNRPYESQVTLQVGCVLPASTAASAPVEEVLVYVLDARLDDDLRQRAGTTYGVGVKLERLRGGTTVLHLESAIANENLAASLRSLRAWFLGNDELLSAGDVELARFGALRDHVLASETSVGLANLLFDYARRELSPADLDQHAKRVADVKLESVQRLLATCRDTSLFSAVGNEARIRAAWTEVTN